MAKRRKTRREQDETLIDIVQTKEEAQDFFEKNQSLVLGILIGLVVGIGGYLAYKYAYQVPREAAGSEALYVAENQFARDSFALALESPGGDAEGFLDIIENYSGTQSANLAKYYAGVSYLNLGRYEDAISFLESYDADDSVTPIMKNGALADAYAETGDLEKAKSLYKRAANAEDNNMLSPYYLYKYALLSRRLGNDSDAMEAFKTISEKYPESTQARTAEKFIAQTNG